MSDSPAPARFSPANHVAILTIAGLVLVLAFAMEVHQNQQVAFRWAAGRPLPQVCGMRRWLGIRCPACGLTRSFICLADGSPAASFKQHRLGWFIALAFLIQIPYRIAALTTGRDAPWGERFPTIFWWSLPVLLIANWLVGFLVGD